MKHTALCLIPALMACPLACAPTATPLPSAGGINEIVLERSGHRPDAPRYKVVLTPNGEVTYTGYSNVARIGTFHAKIEPRDFRRLQEMIDHLHYFEMKDEILHGVDVDSVTTSVVRGGQQKTMDDAWGSTAPVELWTIEMAIDGLVAGITDWEQAK